MLRLAARRGGGVARCRTGALPATVPRAALHSLGGIGLERPVSIGGGERWAAREADGALARDGGVDILCWQAARGLAAVLPPHSEPPQGVATRAGGDDDGLAAIEWFSAHHTAAAVSGPQTGTAAVEAQRLDGGAAGSAEVAMEMEGEEEEEREVMWMSSVLKKRRAKIKKHW